MKRERERERERKGEELKNTRKKSNEKYFLTRRDEEGKTKEM